MAFSKKTTTDNGAPAHQCPGLFCGVDFGRKILLTLFGILLVYVTFYVGVLSRNVMEQYYHIGQADESERTITVTGYGKVEAKNDIAVTTLGYTNTDADVTKAQSDNTKVMNQLMSDLESQGIDSKDLQTDYSISPQYSYVNNVQQLQGYQVNSTVAVKIRDLSKISAILSLAGKYGANEVGGLNFTIDDPETLKDQAQMLAVADAKAKAAQLSRSLGVVLGGVVAYNDYESSPTSPMPMYAAKDSLMMAAPAALAPTDIAAGSNAYEMNVSVTYKIYSAAW